MNSPSSVPLCRAELVKIRKRAFRRRIWFKVLSRTERALVDLTMKVVDKVRSNVLAKVLRSIIMRLCDAMESKVRRLMRVIGIDLAHEMSEVGKKLGCKSAETWADDQGFIQFLTITYVNKPGLYKTS